MSLSKNAVLSTCLFVSIVGNLMLGGMVIGGHYAAHESGDQLFAKAVLQAESALPADQRQHLQQVMDAAQAGIKEKHQALHQQRELIHRMLQAPALDRKQLEIAFAKYRELTGGLQSAIQTMMLDVSLGLPAAQRQQVMDELDKTHDSGR